MWRVYTVNKNNRQRVSVIAEHLTEQQAQSICESWGWNYCDEEGNNFWIDYEFEN